MTFCLWFAVEVVKVATQFPSSSMRHWRTCAKEQKKLLRLQHAFPTNVERVRFAGRMHDSRFYENEKKHEVAIFENKRTRGRPKDKGYIIATHVSIQVLLVTFCLWFVVEVAEVSSI